MKFVASKARLMILYVRVGLVHIRPYAALRGVPNNMTQKPVKCLALEI